MIGCAPPPDPELLDQGKQTKSMLVQQGFGPHETQSLPRGRGQSNECVMEMRNGDDIPGVTGQGTRKIVDEMGDDNFDDLLGKSGGRGRTCGEARPKYIPQIPARSLYQVCMTSSSITAVDV